MTENTLRITFGEADEHRDAARERLRRAEAGASAGEIEQDVQFILNFEEYADIERLMRQSNLKLLEAIVDERPSSIRAAAEAVDRDYKEVHRNLNELEGLGVIEFVTEGVGKKPVLRDGAEEIDVSVRFGGDADGPKHAEAVDG